MLKEYVFTYSVVVEANNLEQAKEEFAEMWQSSKDYLDYKRGETEVDLFSVSVYGED